MPGHYHSLPTQASLKTSKQAPTSPEAKRHAAAATAACAAAPAALLHPDLHTHLACAAKDHL
jgi:hypothetical protein